MALTAQERILAIILELEKNHVFGVSNKELAKAVGASEVNVCRDLQVLVKFELVSKNNSGRWRLSVQFGKIANSIMKSFQTAKLHLSEDEAQYASAMQ